MSDLAQKTPERIENTQPEQVDRQPESPDIMGKLAKGVQQIEHLTEKLDHAEQQSLEARSKPKVAKKETAQKTKLQTVNWNFLISSFRKASHLVNNMHAAIEYLAQVRTIVFQHSDKKLRMRIQRTLTATYLFFVL